jgi:protein-S-isoprenylcysteine O-methyltransferase Ste14
MNIIKTLIFLFTVPGTVLVHIPLRLARGGASRGRKGAASAFLAWAGGAVLLLWPMWNFSVQGRGSPSPADPPKKLVVEGPYRYVRNPMYLAAGLVLLGHWLRSGSRSVLIYGLAVVTAFHLFVVHYEEPNLERRFGEAYRKYRASVPRWLPKLRIQKMERLLGERFG